MEQRKDEGKGEERKKSRRKIQSDSFNETLFKCTMTKHKLQTTIVLKDKWKPSEDTNTAPSLFSCHRLSGASR